MDRDTHKILVQEYISLGGNVKRVNMIKSYSLSNYLKLKHWVKELKKNTSSEKQESNNDTQETRDENIKSSNEIQYRSLSPNKVFNDLISQYPQELHQVYKKRYELWLDVCSLKIQLNAVDIPDENKAYEIQVKMFNALDEMDKCQKSLDYYKEYKRILLTETKENFKDLTPMELIKKRNNLRTNITKRKATIRKMENALPAPSDEHYKRDLHLLNLKREQLQEYENQVEQLNKIINGE